MTQITLEGNKTESGLEKIKKRNGIITIDFLTYDNNSDEHLKNYREKNIPLPKIKGFSVDFDGWNEGSGSPCKDEKEVKENVENLLKNHSKNYNLKIIDKRKEEKKLVEPQKDLYIVCNEKEKSWS